MPRLGQTQQAFVAAGGFVHAPHEGDHCLRWGDW
jgi:hypothetical protein